MHFELPGRVLSRHGRKTNQKPEVLRRQTVAARESDSIVLAEALWNPQFSIRLPRLLFLLTVSHQLDFVFNSGFSHNPTLGLTVGIRLYHQQQHQADYGEHAEGSVLAVPRF